jgi:hypothetical protein
MQGARQSAEHFARQRAATVLKRGADPEGICAALDYLLQARAVTGQLICVDGGQHLAWQTRTCSASSSPTKQAVQFSTERPWVTEVLKKELHSRKKCKHRRKNANENSSLKIA